MGQTNEAGAELLLLTAVLVRAARDLTFFSSDNTPEAQKIAAEAFEWIFEPLAQEERITSFHGICQALNLDCEWVRHRILGIIPGEVKSLLLGKIGRQYHSPLKVR